MCDFVIAVPCTDLNIVRAYLSDTHYADYTRLIVGRIAAKRKRLEESGYALCRAKSNGYVITYQGDTTVFLNTRGTPRIFRNRFKATEYIISYLDMLESKNNERENVASS